MKFIKNWTESGKFFVDFELQNVELGLANAIRRVLTGELSTVAFDKIDIKENLSSFHNEFIQHRVSLIPLAITPIDLSEHQYEFILNKIKNDNYLHYEVQSHDFICLRDGVQIPIQDVMPFNTTIVKLKKDECVEITAYPAIGTCNDHSKWATVSIATYRYKTEKDSNDKIAPTVSSSDELNHIRRSDGNPESYIFQVESIGIYPCRDLLIQTCQYLSTRLSELVDMELTPLDKQSPEMVEYLIPKYNHTFGNLLVYYIDQYMKELYKDEQDIYQRLAFVAYKKEHPLKDEIKLALTIPKTKKVDLSPQDLLKNVVDSIKDILGKIEEEFRSI